ncbi:MAG: 3-phosphoserine/phosphohydroxythreonine transaminase [Candidatus Izemoplasmatales bacterium]|uniref:Phosphoserine aminotransferase n=1 Tax=Hujiaoplasma nucleasis TaxID=2725268 RepID=A0A7L6N2S3_9MOLU|nr:3-phosphoserine/phosphohydroxythreonine transaminase [Hujiaoplasma nucleasis]QLY39527.1 3-phosphoserine/phosphohydroxythreonine transaminase [Hujiaoplasma nucleasis]
MKRVYNFSAGPAVLPEAVLKKAAEELYIYQDTGMSVMEMSHRSKAYLQIITDAEANLRKLMNVPDNYKILFLQGGAHTQFSMVPLNLMKNKKADFITTGSWAKKALKEAKKYLKANEVASSEDKMFSYIPDLKNLNFDPEADYVHICENNTIYGTKYHELPDTKGVDLVSDMSSCILSEPIDVSKYALIYAGAQKNIGPAGTTIVIIREDLVTKNYPEYTPLMLQYDIHVEKESMYNTPPTYGIYMCGLVFKHLLENGGIEAMYEHNKKKAAILYDYLDQSKMFKPTVVKKDRSLMNVTFNTGNDELNKKFVVEAEKNDLVNLKGHRSVGGMRASIYNAMSIEGVEALVNFMRKFESENLS